MDSEFFRCQDYMNENGEYVAPVNLGRNIGDVIKLRRKLFCFLAQDKPQPFEFEKAQWSTAKWSIRVSQGVNLGIDLEFTTDPHEQNQFLTYNDSMGLILLFDAVDIEFRRLNLEPGDFSVHFQVPSICGKFMTAFNPSLHVNDRVIMVRIYFRFLIMSILVSGNQ